MWIAEENIRARLATQTTKEVLDSDIHSVAKKGCVTTEEIERMLKDASKNSFVAKPSCLKRLGNVQAKTLYIMIDVIGKKHFVYRAIL